MIIILAAKGINNEIGKENKLIWNLRYDSRIVKEKTDGNVMIMGRNTFNSLPDILPNRKYIVISTTKKFNKEINPEVETVTNVFELIKKCRNLSKQKDVYVIGGESLFKLFIDYADKMYITQINAKDDEADAFFPDIDNAQWNEKVIDNKTEKDIEFSFIEYTRKQKI